MWLSWGLLFFSLAMMYTPIYFRLMRFEVRGDAMVFGDLNANRISARFEPYHHKIICNNEML